MALTRRGAFVALLCAAAWGVTTSASSQSSFRCSTAEDCNLNGICTSSGTCQCTAAMWTGPDCGTVNFGKAIAPDGALFRREDTSSWCAGVVFESQTKVWHAYVAVMAYHCGLNSWQRNSVIVHTATSPGSPPTGPYNASLDEVIAPPFSHNPKPILAPDGTVLVFHIGCGNNNSNPILNCSGGVTPKSALLSAEEEESGDYGCGGGSTSILASSSPWGPWTTNITVMAPAPNHTAFPSSIDNPSPYFYPNGSIAVMFRSYTKAYPAFHSVIGIGRADSWEGPYQIPTEPVFMGLEEDPFMWYQPSTDSYHALFHDMGGCKNVGCHAFSKDSLAWTLSPTPAYNYTVNFDDGTTTTFSRRERPQIVFDPASGEPTHLINGVQLPASQQPKGGQGDYTYSIIVPLARQA